MALDNPPGGLPHSVQPKLVLTHVFPAYDVRGTARGFDLVTFEVTLSTSCARY
jgi:hypothetical protein